jgi:hypothetical protein
MIEGAAMNKAVRARGHDWQFVDGMFCLTVHGGDRQASVAIPIGALLTLAADGRRRQTALHRQTMAAREAASPEGAPVKHEALLPVQSWSVATADNGMLVLIVDRGLDTEIMLSLTPEVAETLADLFLKHTRGAATP